MPPTHLGVWENQRVSPNLKPCYECGQPISRQAPECPKCKTVFTDGVVCTLCGERLKGSEAVAWDGNKRILPVSACRTTDRCFHRSCYLEIVQPDHIRTFDCCDCGSTLTLDSFLKDHVAGPIGRCPECGADVSRALKIYRCTFCALPLIPDLQHVICVHENRNSGHVVHAPCFRFFRRPLSSFFSWEESEFGKVVRSGGQK